MGLCSGLDEVKVKGMYEYDLSGNCIMWLKSQRVMVIGQCDYVRVDC